MHVFYQVRGHCGASKQDSAARRHSGYRAVAFWLQSGDVMATELRHSGDTAANIGLANQKREPQRGLKHAWFSGWAGSSAAWCGYVALRVCVPCHMALLRVFTALQQADINAIWHGVSRCGEPLSERLALGSLMNVLHSKFHLKSQRRKSQYLR